MTQSMTKPGRATRAGTFTAMLAIIGMTAAMAGVKTARAFDQQASEAALEHAIDRVAAGQGDAGVALPGPYASARRDRRVEARTATRKDFQDQ